jgi:hypothetical protein
MQSSSGVTASIIGALAIAAVSTLGDFVWATWIPRHRPQYGLTHGTLLFLCIGLFLGTLANKRVLGAIAGAVIGFLAAASFYLLAPLTGLPVMFGVWFGVWIALGLFNERLNGRQAAVGSAVTRGLLAAIGSGVAFYLISGIWFPFRPRGWDYLTHFAGWTVAYFPGFAALLVRLTPGAPMPGWTIEGQESATKDNSHPTE